MRYDVIVIGMGIHGLMTTYLLAARGLKVAAVDQYHVPHANGSSHGRTRVYRRAYFEAPFYVPLLKRADELWQQYTDEWQFPVLNRTGVLIVGRDDGRLARGAMASARKHSIEVDVMDAGSAMQRWPGLRIPKGHLGVFEPEGGVLQVEHVISRLHHLASESGATLINGRRVEKWDSDFDGMRVRLEGDDDWMLADRLVLATGAWFNELSRRKLPLKTERQFQVMFRTEQGGAYSASRMPAIAIDRGRAAMLYGIPDFGRGFKLAFHHGGKSAELHNIKREVSESEVNSLRKAAREWLPTLGGEARDAWTCVYTNTPDEQFIIDRHPKYERVVLLSCCSGHGYKFAPVVGEIAAQLTMDGGTEHDIREFSLSRFRQA